jgi:hypothetical protein
LLRASARNMKDDINVDLTMMDSNVLRLMEVTQDRFVIGGGFTPRLLNSFGLATHRAKLYWAMSDTFEICNKLTLTATGWLPNCS